MGFKLEIYTKTSTFYLHKQKFKYKLSFFFFLFWLSDNDKEVHAISDESEFGDANEGEINELPNATLRDFDDYLINDVGYVTVNNNDNVVYNDQSYFEELIQDKKNCGLHEGPFGRAFEISIFSF